MARRRTSQFKQGGGNVIEGVDDLIADLNKLAGKVTGSEVVEAMKPAARIYRDTMRQFARLAISSGSAAAKIANHYATKSGHKPERLIEGIFYDARHAWYTIGGPSILFGVAHWHSPQWHFLEYGLPSRGVAAYPFIRPSRDAAHMAANAQLQADIKKLIDSAGK